MLKILEKIKVFFKKKPKKEKSELQQDVSKTPEMIRAEEKPEE